MNWEKRFWWKELEFPTLKADFQEENKNFEGEGQNSEINVRIMRKKPKLQKNERTEKKPDKILRLLYEFWGKKSEFPRLKSEFQDEIHNFEWRKGRIQKWKLELW